MSKLNNNTVRSRGGRILNIWRLLENLSHHRFEVWVARNLLKPLSSKI